MPVGIEREMLLNYFIDLYTYRVIFSYFRRLIRILFYSNKQICTATQIKKIYIGIALEFFPYPLLHTSDQLLQTELQQKQGSNQRQIPR